MKNTLKSLDKKAQKVWTAKTLKGKRSALLDMIASMKGAPSRLRYAEEAAMFTKTEQMDKLAANLMLADNLKVSF